LSRFFDRRQKESLTKKPLKQTYSYKLSGTRNAKVTLSNNDHPASNLKISHRTLCIEALDKQERIASNLFFV
jgi:hypothetical protein